MDQLNPAIENTAQADPSAIYLYLLVGVLIAAGLVWRSRSAYKLELFVLAAYLITGNLNELITFALPGISFFEIQPDRFLFLFFSFFLFRKILFSRDHQRLKSSATLPWFMLFFFGYVVWLTLALFSHAGHYGFADTMVEVTYALNIVVLIYALRWIAGPETLRILGQVMIATAVITSLVSMIQLGIDPSFLRMGDERIAFGTVLRANGIFRNEYCNAYFIITALVWTMVSIKKVSWRYALIALFTIGVICTFQRMSWLILLLILGVYFLYIERISPLRLAFAGLIVVAALLSTVLTFHREIMNSGLVKERLSEVPESRIGYYTMVLDNIWKKPFFGYGGKDNELYYYSMLRITHERKRATGEEGDIHSGYFSALFYYGFPALVFFIGFVLLAPIYFARLIRQNHFMAVPFLLGILYLVGNLTNTLLFWQYISVIYALHLGLGWGVSRRLTTEESATAAIPSSPAKLAL